LAALPEGAGGIGFYVFAVRKISCRVIRRQLLEVAEDEKIAEACENKPQIFRHNIFVFVFGSRYRHSCFKQQLCLE
jgi:hypothetical protein